MTSIAHHNAVLRRGRRRAEELEPRLVRILTPILEQAGREAARTFARMATDHLTASAARGADMLALLPVPLDEVRPLVASLALRASAPDLTSRSTMIALYPRPSEAAALAHPGGEDPGILHVTLAFLGEPTDDQVAAVQAALGAVAASHAPLSGVVGGVGAFGDNGGGHPAIVLPDVPGLVELRMAVTEALRHTTADHARSHGFVPHATVAYNDELAVPHPEVLGMPLHFDELALVRGDESIIRIPLTGARPLTAAGEPARWSAPAPDEVVDVPALVALLRTKTDPVRLAVVETMMGETLAGVGLEFDATNPFAGKILAQSGSQITHIAETTQLNVMRIVKASYEQGLTIPDTASAIRAGMAAASPARATLIARTELVGAVNGASLAATQIVEDVTGEAMYKQWLVGPGAKYPRHEDYDGLDGQTVTLDDYFDVGGFSLQHPGDPDGPPEEVCNCFPGSTLVVALDTRVGFRRRYRGRLVTVETDRQHSLSGTPNHPVLTSAGWKPLDLIREGDYLVCADVREDVARVHPNVDHAPSPIEEIVGALACGAVTRRVRGRAVQFHGDPSADGEVEVVTPYGELRDGIQAPRGEHLLELEFVRAREPLALLSPPRLGLHLGFADGSGSPRLVRGRRAGATLGGGHPRRTDRVRGADPSRLDPEFDEAAADDVSADPVKLAEGLLGCAFAVSLAKVVAVKGCAFHGDVFNLQTGSGSYLAGGIMSHNCRCTLVYTDDASELTAAG